uniref:Lipocalin/cytosolic fatty-acid binding domain-containing protein n=1 Tax=Homalodisca liturata TaxID=320908 RepID=A0A1B6H755_9HEMI
MYFVAGIFAVLFLSILGGTSALNTCDKTIIENIYSINNHPQCILETGYELGHLTFWALPREDLTGVSGLKCIESYLDPPSGKCASGHVIYHFSNGTSIVINYTYYDEGNGHIKEFDESGNEFDLYSLNIDNTSCYYRCVTSKKDGWSFAGVAVSIGTQNDPVVADAVAECKKKIEIVGIQVDLVDLTLCTNC